MGLINYLKKRQKLKLPVFILSSFVIVFFIMIFVTTFASTCYGRMGGGNTFSGGGYSGGSSGGSYSGGSYSSSGSSSGDEAIIGLLIRVVLELIITLCWHYPIIGIPLVIGIVVFFMWLSAQGNGFTVNSFNAAIQPPLPRRNTGLENSLNELIERDPNFSKVLFLDFVRIIYTRYHKSFQAGSKQPQALKSFTAIPLYQRMMKNNENSSPAAITEVKDFIIGDAYIKSIMFDSMGRQLIKVNFIANYVRIQKGIGCSDSKYIEETATFVREKDVLSKGPEKMRSLHCPKCGSPVKCDIEGICANCGSSPKPGHLQWQMMSLVTGKSVPTDRMERGTPEARAVMPPMPIITDKLRDAKLRELSAQDPTFSLKAFRETVTDGFYKLQKAWSNLTWEDSKSLQTESLYQQNLFWIERYKRQQVRNPLDDAKLIAIEPVKVNQDAFFDSITVRITGSGKDYVVNTSNNVVSGNKDRVLQFREYWTFIRRSKVGDSTSGDIKAPTAPCPNCCAPVDIAANTDCPFCGSPLQSDDFDWTLAFISQEGVYQG